jgi:hypothetical protein
MTVTSAVRNGRGKVDCVFRRPPAWNQAFPNHHNIVILKLRAECGPSAAVWATPVYII